MAEARRYGVLPTQPELALRQILQEAQHRWLRPTEVCEILRNYRKFTLTPDPPQKPQSGSLFLFDRKALRYFRKDGHSWRKKKDGKTVREAHERLKVGSVDVLHCYYAHGEDNENFQRRSYWMLEGTYEHIVLVHYREVKEGNRAGVMRPLNGYSTNALSSPTSSKQGTPCMVPTTSPQTSPLVSPRASPSISSPNTTEWSGHMNSSECDEQDSGDEPDQCIPSEFEMRSRDQGSLHHQSNGRLGDTGPSFRALQACASFSTKNLSNAGVTAHSSPPLYSTQHSNALQQAMPDFGVAQEFSVKDEKNNMLQREMSLRDYPFDVTSLPLPPPGGFDLLDWNEYLKSAKFSSVTGGSGGQVLSSPTWTDMLKTSSIMQPQNPNETAVHPKFGPVVFGPMQGLSETSFSDALERELHSGVMVHQQGLAEPEAGKTSTQHSNISDWRAVLEQLGDGGQGQINIFGGFEHEKTHQPQLHLYYQEHQHQEGLKLQQNIQQQHPFSQDDIGELEASRDNNLSHSYSQVSKDFQEDSPLQQEGHDNFKKLDSFGRWMNQEIGGDAENSIITVSSDSAPYWGDALDDQNTAEEVSSLSQQVLLGVGLSPALAPEQCFSITDFSPDYAGSSSETKVLVTGIFLESLKDPNVYKWCCMFGEIEVPAEILQPGVLRCKAPPHSPGRVPFYITRNDRFACSEVREFEFRADSSPLKNSWAPTEGLKLEQHNEEMLLQVRLARLLTSGTKGASRTQPHKGGSILSGKFSCLTVESDQDWSEMEACLIQVSHLSLNVKEQLVQRLLKDKTYELLSGEAEEEGKSASVLDDHGLGVLHMGAALGYDWMIAPVLAAGVNINFRDVHGWTALHWAAYYGREKTVVALLATGAAPGAKTDPTPKFPAGQTPADLASSRRHKGIAGYLAESSLTSHLSSLTLQESMMGNESAALAGEKAVETVAERTSVQLSNSGSEDRLSLQDSLAAVRNAAQAAARIHAAFRIYSFRKRQEACESEEDEYGISDEQARSIIIAQKTNKSGRISREEAMHTAAVRIQRKFRGWKGRRDFLLFRQRIVKIQAHVRGHQVRKHYKKILWSVGIVEKAILRWRRKGRGLRGFCADIPALSGADEEQVDSDGDDFLKVGRKQTEAGLEKALARVQSMVKSREARDQYRRLVESYQKVKVKSSGNTDDASPTPTEYSKYGEDFSMPMTDL